MDGSKYRISNVLDKNLKGWLPVKDFESNRFELPYTTEVIVGNRLNSLEVTEGPYRSKSVYIDSENISPRFFSEYLDQPVVHSDCLITVILDRQILTYRDRQRGLVELAIKAEDIKTGYYSILVPDRRHKEKTLPRYLMEAVGGSRFAETWFPIMKKNFEFRYLHFGSFSRGCITVLLNQTNDWNSLYFYLISSRNNNQELGKLKIV